MKKLNTKWLGSLLCAAFLISSLNAVQLDPETIKLINSSSAPMADLSAVHEEEAARDLLDAQNAENKNISVQEKPVMAVAGADENEEEITHEYAKLSAAYYSSSHQAAYHIPANVSTDGLNVELEDQSIWQVHSWDASKVKKWKPHHIIVIAPNKNIFTKWSYPYKLVNLDTGHVTKAKMKFTPVFNDPNVDIYVHWIEDIDYYNRLLRLEDGSLWSIAWGDSDIMRHFDRYNIVIVGTNDGWFRESCPNILICVKNSAYIRGIVLN